MRYDIFISYASEDKHSVAAPLAEEFSCRGLNVWFDDERLLVGDDLYNVIDNGLNASRSGLLVLSREFFLKPWPRHELNVLKAKKSKARVFPVVHRMTNRDLKSVAPDLARLRVLYTKSGLIKICDEITEALSREHQGRGGLV